MCKKFILILMLNLLLIAPIIAQPMPGKELYNYLEEYIKLQNNYDSNSIKSGIFLGYVRGVIDALEGTALCIPNNIPLEQLISQIVKYMYDNYRQQQLAARNLIFEALRGQFKCK